MSLVCVTFLSATTPSSGHPFSPHTHTRTHFPIRCHLCSNLNAMLPEAIRYKIKWFCKLTDISLAQIQSESSLQCMTYQEDPSLTSPFPPRLTLPLSPHSSSFSFTLPSLLCHFTFVSWLSAPCAEKRKLNTLEKIIENQRKDEAYLLQMLEQASGLHRPHQVR